MIMKKAVAGMVEHPVAGHPWVCTAFLPWGPPKTLLSLMLSDAAGHVV